MKKSSVIPIRGQNDGLADEASIATAIETDHSDPDNQRTRQEDAHDADINNIVRRFIRTGQLPESRNTRNQVLTTIDYGIDLHGALNFSRTADQAFDRMPEDVRKRYPTKIAVIEALERGDLDMRTDAEIEAAKAASQKAGQAPLSTSTQTEPKN